jgi:hypothetical protein
MLEPSREAALERALGDAAALCCLKRSGFCWPWCRARMLCDCTGLAMLGEFELPAEFADRLARA